MIIDPAGNRLSQKDLAHLESVVNEILNPVNYLAIDPGKANGVCFYDKDCRIIFMVTVHADDMVKFLNCFKLVHTCIIEDYRLYPNKMHKQIYSDLETVRVIGRVEGWAENLGIQLIKQGANIKLTGYKWLGQKPPSKSNKKNHVMDANVHFIFWAIRNGKIKAADLL